MAEKIKVDIAVIGGGIVGTAVVHELSRYQTSVVLIEKEAEVGWGTTKANSGIVHAGFHDEPGSLKAKYCVWGNRLYPELCRDLDVSFRQNGIMMVALNEEERQTLEKYYQRGIANGVPDIELVDGVTARQLEPNLQPDVCAALVAPSGGVVNPFELAAALMENAEANGAQLLTESPVENIDVEGNKKIIYTPSYIVEADFVVNAAGLYADRIADMVDDLFFAIKPRKGEEYLLDKTEGDLVTRTIFPVPSKVSKGILAIPTSEGNLMIGPTGDDIEEKDDVTTTPEGFAQILAGVQRLVQGIEPRTIIAQFAGVRAACDRKDFIVERSAKVPGFVHLAGIESPGLTAAPAIARDAVRLLAESGLELAEKPDFRAQRPPFIRFDKLSREEQDELVRRDPRYGRIVCRCETITEGEIVDAIRRGARTIDGVKFRARAGCGRCQGGFCQPLVMQILARELHLPLEQVTKRGGKSRQILYKAKELVGKECEA